MQTDVLQFPKRSESCHEGYQSFPSIKKFNIFWKEEKDQKGVRSYFTLLIFVSLVSERNTVCSWKYAHNVLVFSWRIIANNSHGKVNLKSQNYICTANGY